MIKTSLTKNGEPLFHLKAGDASYVFSSFRGFLVQLYCGPAVHDDDLEYLLVKLWHTSQTPLTGEAPEDWFSCDIAPFEYPSNGCGDFRPSAISVRLANGTTATDLRYVSHEIVKGKPKIDTQPAVFAGEDEADTLIVTAKDPAFGMTYKLYYTAMRDLPVICRRTVIENTTDGVVHILRAYSASVDFSAIGEPTELLHLWGCWARERHVERAPLAHGNVSVSSKRGLSSHYHSPFAALVTESTTEKSGLAIGMSLIYTGNFDINCEIDAFGLIRFMAGINPIDFDWKLNPGESFVTPEAVISISGEGLGKMSRAYHKLYREHLCRGEWANRKRPILINNWEGTYFDFDTEKLLAIAKDAAECGIEMLVMDDGWFGKRNDDTTSLGDWYVNEEKLVGGLPRLVEGVNALGMKFGIWFEPEMISAVSDLYDAHPDWCLHVEGRKKSIGRDQYVLDMTRADVRDYIFDRMYAVLSSANVEYVKWDFNRSLTEVATATLPEDQQGEVFHRYILGLYELLDRLLAAFPYLLLEGCSSGGGRYDPAMLYYSPQFWTSDDTDAMERVDIQLGTSMVYPASSMSCHVSASPNHQTGRETSFVTRGNVAMAGAFGYELDITKLSDEEKTLIRKQVADYHRYYDVINRGSLYRLISPNDKYYGKVGRVASWMYVSDDRSEALVTFVVIRCTPAPTCFIKLEGLDPDAVYVNEDDGCEYSGSTLMNAGLNLTTNYKDGDSVVVYLKKK